MPISTCKVGHKRKRSCHPLWLNQGTWNQFSYWLINFLSNNKYVCSMTIISLVVIIWIKNATLFILSSMVWCFDILISSRPATNLWTRIRFRIFCNLASNIKVQIKIKATSTVIISMFLCLGRLRAVRVVWCLQVNQRFLRVRYEESIRGYQRNDLT